MDVYAPPPENLPVRYVRRDKRIGCGEVRKVVKTVRQATAAVLLAALMAALLRHNGVVAEAVRQGLLLCGASVIPSLFPFFVAVSLAVEGGLFDFLRRLRLPVGAAVFLLGAVGGYPMGARTVAELYRAGTVSRLRAERLLTFCNNAGPAFILSIAGSGIFGSQRIGWVLYGIHILSALLAGGLLRGRFGETKKQGRKGTIPSVYVPITPDNVPFSPAAFVKILRNAALTMVNICAFVIFFLALTALFRQLWPVVPAPVFGLLELTVGITALNNDTVSFCAAAALLGWGGVSVHCQTAAVLEKTGISLKGYLLAKVLQAVVSALLALTVCRFLF